MYQKHKNNEHQEPLLNAKRKLQMLLPFTWPWIKQEFKRAQSKSFWIYLFLRIGYFILFYSFIAACFAGYLFVLQYFSVKRDYPTLSGMSSPLELNPAVSFVPNPSFLTTLIHIRMNEPLSYIQHTNQMSAFLAWYLSHNRGGMFNECDNKKPYLSDRRPCFFDISAGGPCNLKNGFGYYKGEPCFAIKLNRIYGWVPDPVPYSEGVTIKCGGLTPIDEDLLGDVCYFDLKWFRENQNDEDALKTNVNCKKTNGTLDSMFYPYINQVQYHNPLVFVQFPKPKRHVIINIKCEAIAKNIEVNTTQDMGSVRFAILID